MLRSIRALKRRYLRNQDFRRYALYAVGEIVLIVVGILLALQIDNWNSGKLQRESLNKYLNTISGNIANDLDRLKELRAERIEAYELGVRWFYFATRAPSYTVSEVILASDVINEASTLRHFNASTSGYEALKSSGILDELQGTDVETLLYDYYDTVARIANLEQDHNETTRLLSIQLLSRWPENVEPWELSSATTLTAERFESLQPAYRSVLTDPSTQELIFGVFSVGPLLLQYHRLDRLGRAFRHLVEVDSMELDAAAAEILDEIFEPRSGIGQASIIEGGQVNWHSYRVVSSDANDPRLSYEASGQGLPSPYDPDSFRRVGDGLHVDFHGGAAWAGIWFVAGTDDFDRQSPDYSMYDKLLLEMKGDAGGETIIVNMEDRDDPADGTSTRYAIELSDQWQTYEIDLDEFETADLRILSVPLGFVFLDEPVSFSVRTAQFVDTG